jgi:hypothetical protein
VPCAFTSQTGSTAAIDGREGNKDRHKKETRTTGCKYTGHVSTDFWVKGGSVEVFMNAAQRGLEQDAVGVIGTKWKYLPNEYPCSLSRRPAQTSWLTCWQLIVARAPT